MKLEQYISELLYHYDCVVVPGLGGFVANYKSATIQNIQNTFAPPSKSISFNKNLNANDGLLANLIAKKEQLRFEQAIKKIETAVASINRDLKLKKRILLSEVGTLFLDAENRTQFEPHNAVNHLLGSYGLAVFQKQPIQRETIEEKITKEFIDRTAPLVVVKNENSKKWMYAAALIPLAFLAGWMPNNVDLSGGLNTANFTSFTPEVKAVYVPIKSDFIEKQEGKENTVKKQIEAADENAYFLDVSFDETANPVTVQLKEKPIAAAVSTYVDVVKQELRYHIVAGCFSEKRNAKKMVKKLKKQGFDSFIVGKRKGLWAVSYNSFVTRKQAISALEFAQDHNDKAWILNQ